MKKIEAAIRKFAEFIQGNHTMQSISEGLQACVPLLIVGSIFSVLRQLPIDAYQEFITANGIKDLFNIPYNLSTGIMALYACYAIAHRYALRLKLDGFMVGLLSLFAMLIVSPIAVTDGKVNALSFDYLGAKALFTAIIISLLTTRIYLQLVKHKIYIRMPKGVPPMTEKSFAAMVPGLVIAIVMLIIRVLFNMTSYGYFQDFIFSIVQIPLATVGASIPALIFIAFFRQILWWFGIHGNLVIYAVLYPILSSAALENLAAYNAGQPLPNLFIYDTLTLCMCGGAGATFGLAFAMCFFAKSKRYKTLGRLSIVPSFFGINEPLTFGTPLMMSVDFMVPFIGLPTALMAIVCVLTSIGVLSPMNGLHVNNLPALFSNFIYGGISVGIFGICTYFISFIVYWPFFKRADKKAYEEEKAANAEIENTI